MDKGNGYYVPAQSRWPIIAAVGLFLTMLGLATLISQKDKAAGGLLPHGILLAGGGIMIWMLVGWFGSVIREGRNGLYSAQVERSFRIGMGWFIFSEVMLFAAFFGALFYARQLAIPWLGGEGEKGISNMLWPEFTASWPVLITPDMETYPGPEQAMSPWGIPLFNTLLLVTSSGTLTLAHRALNAGQRTAVLRWMAVTLGLGGLFLAFQVWEYRHAYSEMGLTLSAGIYASTFFILTGFHGAHVTLGAIMLAVMWRRVALGHFRQGNQFGFEAAAWYWHFVDVVWIGLFLFVYVF